MTEELVHFRFRVGFDFSFSMQRSRVVTLGCSLGGCGLC